jgi:hypothetical protein
MAGVPDVILEDGSDQHWSTGELPRLQSQGSLRLRSGLASQASLKGFEAAALLRQGSMKVNVALGATDKLDSMEATARRSAIRARLEDLDANHDGIVDKEDLVSFIDQTISTEQRLRTVTWVATAAVVALVVFAGATFGLTYAVVDMAKDAQPALGAWADRSSMEPLRTAHGGFMELNFTRSPIPQRAVVPGAKAAEDPADIDFAAAAARGLRAAESAGGEAHELLQGVDFDDRAAVRALLQSGGPPLGTVARANAETACRWLTEGNINIPLKVVDAFGAHYPAGGATVAEAKGCRDLARAPRSKAAIAGTLVYHKITYVITCKKGASRCSIRYAKHSGPTAGMPKKNGRRLQADETGAVNGECPPVEVGGALQPVDRLSDGSCPNCFPAGATATLRDGSARALSALAVGDQVQVVEDDGSLSWSTVYLFPHFEATGAHTFLRVSTAANASITLSADHYLYTAPAAGADFAERTAVPAAEVRPGALLWRRTERGRLALELVTGVQPVSAEGLVNPFTLRGNIIVDGVAASVYNTAMGGEARMHAFTGMGRALWRRAPALLRWAHATRAAQPLSLAIGRFFAKNLQPAMPGNPALHWAAVRLSSFSA